MTQARTENGPGQPGAGYGLSAAEAVTLLGQAQSAVDALDALRENTGYLRQVRPAALDPASVRYNARLADDSGVFGQAAEHVAREAAHLRELIARIREAFEKAVGREPLAAEELARAASGQGSLAG